MSRKSVIHINSHVYESGAPKAPSASTINYGEIAVNYSNEEPCLFIKKENGSIVKFNDSSWIEGQGYVKKTGDTMSGALEISSEWDEGGLTVRNDNSSVTIKNGDIRAEGGVLVDGGYIQAISPTEDWDWILAYEYPNTITLQDALNAKQDTLVSGENIKTVNGTSLLGSGNVTLGAAMFVETTYAELKNLRDGGQLIPGMSYRITDYRCTCVRRNATAANNQFDVIVVADSENTLNENARAALHYGDTYFANCKLENWELKYCIDNDSSRFDWADETNGKGVIYHMKDEFNNECGYDFKNIQYWRLWDEENQLWSEYDDGTSEGCVAAYVFSSEGDESTTEFTDYSLSRANNVVGNIIKDMHDVGIDGEWDTPYKLCLNNICFFGGGCFNNQIELGCYTMTFGSDCSNNVILNNCYDIIFKYGSSDNYLDQSSYGIVFGEWSWYNKIGTGCRWITFADECESNTIGCECDDINFMGGCYANEIGNGCWAIYLGNENMCNTFGSCCNDIEFGDFCKSNSLGNECADIYFASDSEGTVGDYFYYNTLDNGVSDCILYNESTASSNMPVKNYHIKSSVTGVEIEAERNLEYDITVALNSSGDLKIYCEADLIA